MNIPSFDVYRIHCLENFALSDEKHYRDENSIYLFFDILFIVEVTRIYSFELYDLI